MIRLANKQEVNFLNSQLEYKISENNFEKCYIDEQNNIIIGLIDFSDLYDRLELNYIWVNPDYRGNKNSDILIGDLEYIPVCRSCYNKLMIENELKV